MRLQINEISRICWGLVFVVCFACSKKNDDIKSSETIEVNEFEFKNDGTLTDWHCFNTIEDKVCIPQTWEIVVNHAFHFFSYLRGKENKNDFFVIVRYDTSAAQVSLESYLHEVVKQVKGDTNEVSKEGNFRYLVFEESPPCYYGEFVTEIADEQYYTYSMYTIRYGYLYDFTLKTRSANKDNLYRDFRNILFNYKIEDKYLFKKEDPIVSIKLIDPNIFL